MIHCANPSFGRLTLCGQVVAHVLESDEVGDYGMFLRYDTSDRCPVCDRALPLLELYYKGTLNKFENAVSEQGQQ